MSGWREIGAGGVSLHAHAVERWDGECSLSVGVDPADGQVAVAVWEGGRRNAAFWMPSEAAERLRDALVEATQKR